MNRFNLLLFFTIIVIGTIPIAINSNLEPESSHDDEVLVELFQWGFNFTHNGETDTNLLVLLTWVNYMFNVTALDVPHGLDLNGVQFRPQVGQYVTDIITFTQAGQINLQCRVFCGTGHGTMSAQIIVEANPDATSTSASTTSAATSVTSTSNSTGSNTGNITETITETITTFNATTITESHVSNQTRVETSVVTTTLIEQLSFPILSLLGLTLMIMIPRAYRRKFD